MINEVKIFNRFNMDTFLRTGGLNFPYNDRIWHLISIHTDDNVLLTDKNRKIFKDMGCSLAMSLSFWDITDKEASKIASATVSKKAKELQKTMKIFSTDMAKEVIGFLMMCNQDDEDDCVLVVHCDAGVSRSGAVGTFAVDFLNLDYEKFIKQNPYIIPNPYVLKILRKMACMSSDEIKKLNERDEAMLKANEEDLIQKRKEGHIFLP